MAIYRLLRSIIGRPSKAQTEDRNATPIPGTEAEQSNLTAFFLRPENANLYTCCPLHADLPRISSMEGRQKYMIECHWLGHLLDMKAGEPIRDPNGRVKSAIPQEGIEEELRYIYNDLSNHILGEARQSNTNLRSEEDIRYQNYGPEKYGCQNLDARAELMAEAFRAYMSDPNYIKTVAPAVAKRIRQYVNPNPAVNIFLQFN